MPVRDDEAVITAELAVIDSALVGPVTLRIEGGHIAEVTVGDDAATGAQRPVEPGVLTAGLVDVQVNGAVGHDLAVAGETGWRAVAEHLVGHGVTSFCPTAITAPISELLDFVGRAREAADALADAAVAHPIGAHLEGPFISPDYCGAHDPAAIVAPSPDAVGRLAEAAADGAVAMVTLAPEVPGGVEAVAQLAAAGVAVSVGHSGATDHEVEVAVAAGATWVTHLYNAQRPFHHREPGIIGRALVDDRLRCGLIADGHHVSDTAVRLAFMTAAERVALVSDAMAAAGMPAGEYRIGNRDVVIVAGDVPRLSDGTVAGSVLHLDEAVRNVIALGVDPGVAIAAATSVAAGGLGRADLGVLAVGATADVVRWDRDWHVTGVWSAGLPVTGT